MAASALETDRLCKSFGALTVADRIGFRLEPGARHALIGPNGAGKTTFVNMLTGAIPPSSGRILLGGEDITRVNQAARVRRGLGRTFQVTTLFRSLPVLDNVALGIAERDGIARRMWIASAGTGDAAFGTIGCYRAGPRSLCGFATVRGSWSSRMTSRR